mmetsp:Transcript_44615/g.140808  ORF Transcript_44615/g.140808 Transcript_44615/m.140808 type:complete len:450 (-) Transcript_44615:779-2128(-)
MLLFACPLAMLLQVWYDGESYNLQCGTGMQRVAWIARVAAQRFGAAGIWCSPGKEVQRPKEFIPGRVFLYPSEQELDPEATILSLVEGEPESEEVVISVLVELRSKPAPGLPSLAAHGSEDNVVPPKSSKSALNYKMEFDERGRVVTMMPAPLPGPRQGYDFMECYEKINISDIKGDSDNKILTAMKHVLSNNFNTILDIFLHYATPTQPTEEEEEVELVITMSSMALFARTCHLTSDSCSFLQIQLSSVQPDLIYPVEEEWNLGIFDARYNFPGFMEALARIAHLKKFGMFAICDQLNKLLHTQILPYATGDDVDSTRELLQRPSVKNILFNQRSGIRKFYHKRLNLENDVSTNARSMTLYAYIAALRAADQLDEELTPQSVKEIWLATISYEVPPDLISEDDKKMEIALCEFEEIIVRSVLHKSKVNEDGLPQQLDLFIKRFLRYNV